MFRFIPRSAFLETGAGIEFEDSGVFADGSDFGVVESFGFHRLDVDGDFQAAKRSMISRVMFPMSRE